MFGETFKLQHQHTFVQKEHYSMKFGCQELKIVE